MSGAKLDGESIFGLIVATAIVAVSLWELAQWVFRHLRVEWIA